MKLEIKFSISFTAVRYPNIMFHGLKGSTDFTGIKDIWLIYIPGWLWHQGQIWVADQNAESSWAWLRAEAQHQPGEELLATEM